MNVMVYMPSIKDNNYSMNNEQDMSHYSGKMTGLILLTKSTEQQKECKERQRLTRNSIKFDPSKALRGPVFSRKPKQPVKRHCTSKENDSVDSDRYSVDKEEPIQILRITEQQSINVDTEKAAGRHRPNVEHCTTDSSDDEFTARVGPFPNNRHNLLSSRKRHGLSPEKGRSLPIKDTVVHTRPEKLLNKRGSFQPMTSRKESLPSGSYRQIQSRAFNVDTDHESTGQTPIAFSFAPVQRRSQGVAFAGKSKGFSLPAHQYNSRFILKRRESEQFDFVADEAIRKSISKCKAWILKYWDYL